MAPRYALISTFDKAHVADFARRLQQAGLKILSTGGTARVLRQIGVEVIDVAQLTGFPEILHGRVKTLHPMIHGGLLARRDMPEHLETMRSHGLPDIAVVAVNLYPFREATADPNVSQITGLENIDIGGPTMLRAAAKNFPAISVVVDPDDYDRVASAFEADGDTTVELRRQLALKAFRHTASYDHAICGWLAGRQPDDAGDLELRLIPTEVLRYGENPHQEAALYRRPEDPAYGGLEQLHGKALSYNNIVDLDGALELVREFDAPAAAVIKHTNPAGCATAPTIEAAFEQALACDPMSAFGGIVVLNRPVGPELAATLSETFFEIIAAPDFDDEARSALQRKKNLRLMRLPEHPMRVDRTIRATTLGHLVQDADPPIRLDREAVEIPTSRSPSDAEWEALAFAWRACKHVKSNAIVLARGTRTIGIGAGQMSRIDAVKIAVDKSREDTDGAVLASDAFFPFRDGVDAAAAAGVTAIIQPGGSRRDAEVVEACDEHDIAMVFTGERHFRH